MEGGFSNWRGVVKVWLFRQNKKAGPTLLIVCNILLHRKGELKYWYYNLTLLKKLSIMGGVFVPTGFPCSKYGFLNEKHPLSLVFLGFFAVRGRFRTRGVGFGPKIK